MSVGFPFFPNDLSLSNSSSYFKAYRTSVRDEHKKAISPNNTFYAIFMILLTNVV